MHTKSETPASNRRMPSHPIYVNEGLSPKKTAFIIVTVIGCIAILWPKVFYPMMLGGNTTNDIHKNQNFKEQRPPIGCCFNATPVFFGPQLYRKQLNLFTGEISLRQERPAHLHPDSVYQAMRERGRAIPATQTIPIVEGKGSVNKPRFVEGRPGPIPGMRPPMGAGALHQPQTKGTSMGFVMPLYTIGIVIFFGYTIMKIAFKKNVPNAPYGPAPTDPAFRKEVFGQENGRHNDDAKSPKLVVTAIQGLIDAADEQLKLREQNATSDSSQKTNDNLTSNIADISNEHTDSKSSTEDKIGEQQDQRKSRAGSADRSVASKNELAEDQPEPQSIYLEGTLAHESQILVSDSKTTTENVFDAELNGSSEEPAVVLSSKMTLSLINLDANQPENLEKHKDSDVESPLADDIEIIGPFEK